MKKCVQTDDPELIYPINYQREIPGKFPKIENLWGHRFMD